MESLRRNTILVVDDEPNILRQLEFVLDRAGLKFISATDGESALQAVRDHRPAVVLLDIMMPRMNCYDVCRAIKGDGALRDTYIAILTAKGLESDRERGFAAGADEFIVKPFNPVAIAEQIKTWITARDHA